MEKREKISIEGCPGVWTTNLSDAEARLFYETVCRSAEPRVISLGFFGKNIEIRVIEPIRASFQEGACMWSLVQENYTAIYRTNYEWEIIDARRGELDELREEEMAEIRLFKIEDEHLMKAVQDALADCNFERADSFFRERLRLRRISFQGKRRVIYFPPCLIDDAIRIYSRFDDVNCGLGFFEEIKARSGAYHSLATFVSFRRSEPLAVRHEKMVRVYQKAMRLFPQDGGLLKDACLLWRREGRLDMAIEYCRHAIANGVSDDTRTGFEGRLRRLLAESSRVR